MDRHGRQSSLRNAPLAPALSLIALMAASPVALGEQDLTQGVHHDMSGHYAHPQLSGTEPVTIPIKAMIERLALGASAQRLETRPFRYDIDALGIGLALRMRLTF